MRSRRELPAKRRADCPAPEAGRPVPEAGRPAPEAGRPVPEGSGPVREAAEAAPEGGGPVREAAPEGGGLVVDAPPEEIRISVRGLVEFVLRHGDIDDRRRVSPENAMQEGGRIHRMIQRRMGAEYQAEVPLRRMFPAEGYVLTVEGRADGIIRSGGRVTVDEIKGTYRDLVRINSPMPLHLAQAKCYAYLYGAEQGLEEVGVRLTYCHMPSGEIRYFHEVYAFGALESWFGGVLAAYRRWADYSWRWRGIRQASIAELEFPYPYREGQRELVGHVYRTICHGRKLFLEAPTGVGKTLSTLYPSIQAMGRGMGERLFYLTAKTITRTVAEDAVGILRGKGLRFKSVILTAKEKICFQEETACNPEHCPYARGHYDRINEALFDLLTSRECFDREAVEAYARKHRVCPFELCLDVSLYADAVICDYNYLFDPHVYLKRFFGESRSGNFIFLIDEAHNLLERGREMYSASLWKEDFLTLRGELKKTFVSEKKKREKSDMSGQLRLDMTLLLTEVSEVCALEEGAAESPERADTGPEEGGDVPVWEGEPELAPAGFRGGRSVLERKGYAEKLIYHLEKCNRELVALKRQCGDCRIVESIEPFAERLMRLCAVLEDYLSEQEEGRTPIRERLLEFYFQVSHFFAIYELLDDHYVKYTRLSEDGGFLLKLFCVNPRENLKRCMGKGRSAVLFSATLLPIQYYKRLLGGDPEDYEVYARSVFRPERRALLVAGDVTSRYDRRSEGEYGSIARYIEEIVKNRHGNYMVFCPSHAFLRTVYGRYVENFGAEGRECILQSESMGEAEREAFLDRFRRPMGEGAERILIGFCVLGGIFSEGIDLKRDSLIGAIIVGTGLPQVSRERELLRAHFGGGGEDGFDYAYRYPGMNKVLQAAGRVIRTAEDVGIIALLDERFLQPAYRRLFPREWEQFETVTVNDVAKRVERFWDEWL